MEEWDMVTSRDEIPVEEIDCVAPDEVNIEMFPLSPLKLSKQENALEEKPPTISVPTSPKSGASADAENESLDSVLVLDEALEEGQSQSNMRALQEPSAANTAAADVQPAKIAPDSVLTVVLDESSESNSVATSPKSSDPNASADVSQDANNESDNVLTVVLEEESSGSGSVPASPKSSLSSSASSDVVQQSDSAVVLNEILEEESSHQRSEPNSASADAARQADKDAALVLNEELEGKPSTSGSISCWEKSSIPCITSVAVKQTAVDPNKELEEEAKAATEEDRNEELILNDKTLLAQSLIAKLMNILLAKRLSEIRMKPNSRKRQSSDTNVAGGTSTSGLNRGPPPPTMTSGTNLMDYYISKQRLEGKGYECSQLLTEHPGLIMELNYYAERMKAFVMLPKQEPEQAEESNPSNGKRARKEDKTNGAQNSEITDLT